MTPDERELSAALAFILKHVLRLRAAQERRQLTTDEVDFLEDAALLTAELEGSTA